MKSPRLMLNWPFSPATILKRKELSIPRLGNCNDELSPILNLIQFHSPNLGPEARSDPHHSEDCLTPRRLFDDCPNGSLSPRATHGFYNRCYQPLCKSNTSEHTHVSSPPLPQDPVYMTRQKNFTEYTRTSTTGRHNRITGYSGSATPFSLSDSHFQTKGDRIIRKRKRKTMD